MWALAFSGQNDEFDTDEFCLSLDAECRESKTKSPICALWEETTAAVNWHRDHYTEESC